ncbi:MAG: hypothetical protein ACOYEV_06810 [Candidatus Nanopelagicales bacterium]
METKLEIHVDRHRPPQLTFTDTGGEPILAFHDEDEPGWVLHVEHYQPFPMDVAEFERAFEALAEAKSLVEQPLPYTSRIPGRQVNLRSDWGPAGSTSYFLDVTLEHDGSLRFSGQDLGPTVSYDGEYEYWYSLAAEDVPALVIALGGEPGTDIIDLLESRWSGDAASGLGAAIKASGVKHNFTSYF